MEGINCYPSLSAIEKIKPDILKWCGVTYPFIERLVRGFKPIKPVNLGTKKKPNWKYSCRIDGKIENFPMVTDGLFVYVQIPRKPLFVLLADEECNDRIYIKLF